MRGTGIGTALNAVLKMGLLLNEHKAGSVYWYTQLFILPIACIIAALMEYLEAADMAAYAVMVGLLFGLVTAIYKKKGKGVQDQPKGPFC